MVSSTSVSRRCMCAACQAPRHRGRHPHRVQDARRSTIFLQASFAPDRAKVETNSPDKRSRTLLSLPPTRSCALRFARPSRSFVPQLARLPLSALVIRAHRLTRGTERLFATRDLQNCSRVSRESVQYSTVYTAYIQINRRAHHSAPSVQDGVFFVRGTYTPFPTQSALLCFGACDNGCCARMKTHTSCYMYAYVCARTQHYHNNG